MDVSRIDVDDTLELIEVELRSHRVNEVGQCGVRQWSENRSLIKGVTNTSEDELFRQREKD